MTVALNLTHDPGRRSWVESANRSGADFPLQNLPYGVFRHGRGPRIGVAIGDRILDLFAAASAGLVPASLSTACQQPVLNALMAAGPQAWAELRLAVSRLLGEDSCPAGVRHVAEACLVPAAEAQMLLPADIGGFTDFYASIHHATRAGQLFRPEAPLLPNYRWLPIGYDGRASCIVPSGASVRRPAGQLRPAAATDAPEFAPTRQLDYELELGLFVGAGNALGAPVPIAAAAEQLFGAVLLNDWSARDIQSWEYQPLGPFLAKSFATTVSPWIVTLEALAPFRVPAAVRAAGDPAPLPYLADAEDARAGGLGIELEVRLSTERMRDAGAAPEILARSNSRHLYWTPAQLVAHHTSNGCNLRPGDLLGTGTISGPELAAAGCLLEQARRGAAPIRLASGEERAFLADGDEVELRGFARRDGFASIGFGTCRGLIAPPAR